MGHNRYNSDPEHHAYPIGFVVKDWGVPPRPQNFRLIGDHVSVVTLDVRTHAQDLWLAFGEDADQTNWRYMPYGPFADFAVFQAWLAELNQTSDPYFVAFINKKSGKCVGMASYLRIKPKEGSIEVGHIHFSEALQRTIAATEAMFLMMRWAFQVGYRRYEWKCNALNTRSRRSAQRLGFSYEGIFRQAAVSKGRNRDTAWFAMIDQEWPTIQDAYCRWLDVNNFDDQGQQKIALTDLTAPLLYRQDA